jgi:uncharacterized protein YegJ (DUF2314 family)
MSDSPVFMFDDNDVQMQAAHKKARANFKYFWRELAWERRRIVPGLDLAVVKAPFSDGPKSRKPEAEHMWLDEVDFDGKIISGVLVNSPRWLQSVRQGDRVEVPLAHISDWMYVQLGEVFGGYSINLMRSRMGSQERAEHDAAWGLKFGDPKKVYVVPEQKKSGGFLSKLFGGEKEEEIGEHPMSENMGPDFRKQLQQNPSIVSSKDDRGWAFLHQQALAGSLATVKILVEFGADVNAVTDHGMTPLQLAQSLGWDKVVALLKSRGAK